MSIATLKRKTLKGGNPRLDPVSSIGANGFSLNGGHRNIGAVGQFRMISNVTRTPFRGTQPMGHGGFDGEYYNQPLNSGSCCTNDNAIIKHSTLNTAGMLDEKYKWTKSQYPNYWVKDDNNSYRITKTQGQLLGSKTWAAGACNFEKVASANVWQCNNKCIYWIGGKKKFMYYPYAKWLNTTKVQSQGTYINAGGVARSNCLPTPPCIQHYPMMLSHNHTSCNINPITWQEAQLAGLLPPNYLNCSITKTYGIKYINIHTPFGVYKVWTKRVGNNPTLKVLFLHGGPGATSEIFEVADLYFPNANIEYYYYDQLGSSRSDNPNDERLWEIDRFVDELEQVRVALGLDATNLVLFGQSWGGILAIEYALKYQQHLKGLIISNMMSSISDYNEYVNDVLAPQLPPDVLTALRGYEANEDYNNPIYLELIHEHYYPKHVLRMNYNEWPDSVVRTFNNLNYSLYLKMQGPSEFGVVGNAVLKNWERTSDLHKIVVPTLTIGAKYDTMDPAAMQTMSTLVQNGTYLYCPNGSHLALYDDQITYFNGIISFLKNL